MKYLQKNGRPRNSRTYCSDNIMPHITKYKRNRDKVMHPHLHKEGGPRNCQELPRYNPYKIYNALLRTCIEPKH